MKALNDIRTACKTLRDAPDYMDRELCEIIQTAEVALHKALRRARFLGETYSETAARDLVEGDRVITDGDVGTVVMISDTVSIRETVGNTFPARANPEDLFLVARSETAVADWNRRREVAEKKYGTGS